MANKRIGVLEIQGDFSSHEKMLKRAGAQIIPVRTALDLTKDLAGLVLPGGESTTMSLMIQKWNLFETLQKLINTGLPVFATCAGSILLAQHILNNDGNQPVKSLNVIDLTVDRNGFGRQVESFEVDIEMQLAQEQYQLTGVFIRAPRFINLGNDVKPIGKILKGEYKNEVVAVQKDNIIAISFHPELTNNIQLQQYFLSLC